ncbi:MAG: phenylacetate--CoA ligase, partial [Chloroflexota bacterium]|nr:phenylacetate--CoA ligase [Chloroflexota bacterium]
RSLQLERLRDRVAYVYDRVPVYRQRLDEASIAAADIRTLDDLHCLPFTKKKDLRDYYPTGLLAMPLAECARVHASSGTKGKPTIVAYSCRDLQVWSEVCARSIVSSGGRRGDVLQVAFGYGLFTGGLGFHQGAELLGCTVIPASSGNSARQVLLLQDLQARGLCCTPSYALSLADTMSEMGVSLDQLDLRYGVFGAEPWTDGLRDQIEARLGLQAFDAYGLSEICGPGVAVECQEKHGLHIWEDHFLPEIVDPATGEPLPLGATGELVLTNLTKEALCLLRYRTGDLTSLHDEPCSCGRTHLRMSRVTGRVDDMLIIRGVNVFPSEVEAVLLDAPEVAPHYQLVVRRQGPLDDLEVQIETAFELNEEVRVALQHRLGRILRNRLGIGCSVAIQPPKTIPRSEGKAIRVVDRRHL